jgi:hypothetical protein
MHWPEMQMVAGALHIESVVHVTCPGTHRPVFASQT